MEFRPPTAFLSSSRYLFSGRRFESYLDATFNMMIEKNKHNHLDDK